jgi:hypothetical protein
VRRSERRQAAEERGVTELYELVKWHYRDRPRQLARYKKAYSTLCVMFFRALERRFDGKRK